MHLKNITLFEISVQIHLCVSYVCFKALLGLIKIWWILSPNKGLISITLPLQPHIDL